MGTYNGAIGIQAQGLSSLRVHTILIAGEGKPDGQEREVRRGEELAKLNAKTKRKVVRLSTAPISTAQVKAGRVTAMSFDPVKSEVMGVLSLICRVVEDL